MLHYISNTTCLLPFLDTISLNIIYLGCNVVCYCLATTPWYDGLVQGVKRNLVGESGKCFVVFTYEYVFACWPAF